MGTQPRERVRAVAVSTPANTALAAAQSTVWTIGGGVLERIDVVIPDGHVGLTGIQILWGGRQVVPYEGSDWLVGNGDEITVELGLDLGAGSVVVRTYNTDDTYAHSHYLRAYVVDAAEVPALFGPEPALGVLVPAGGGLELPGPPVSAFELTDEEWTAVSAASDAFLSDLQAILDAFLSDLQATLTGAAPATPAAPPAPSVSATVPSVVGMQQTAGANELRGAGYLVEVVDKVDLTVARFQILAQKPKGGAQAPLGSVVTITVAKRK